MSVNIWNSFIVISNRLIKRYMQPYIEYDIPYNADHVNSI